MSGKTYEVEDVIDKKEVDGKTLYLVKWKNYPKSQNTWEPKENFDSDVET